MALGGGNFTAQNKVLPGSYINFVAASRASSVLSDRGIVAMPLVMSWGPEGEVFEVTKDEFKKNSKLIFGYENTTNEMLVIRELFLNASKALFFRLGKGATYSENKYAKARYPGVRGNSISISISKNNDNDKTYDVKTLLDSIVVDVQKAVSTIADLKENSFVKWKQGVTLTVEANIPLVGGTNASKTDNYSEFLNKIESYSFNILTVENESANTLFENFTKSMREDKGVKFQTVLYNSTANYEGIISISNKVFDEAENEISGNKLVYWVAGSEAACAINQTMTNSIYDGEMDICVDYTQTQLENCIKTGKLVFHRVGESIRILEDINTLTKYDNEKSSDFSDNQVIRVLDQVGNDIAALFNEHYLGKVPNDESSRIGLWSDIVTHHKKLESLRAIENFESEHVVVEKGEGKKSVIVTDTITPVCAMTKLYMTVVVE